MKMSDKMLYFLTGIVTIPLTWLVASYVNVIMHNCTDYVYASWNLFKILF